MFSIYNIIAFDVKVLPAINQYEHFLHIFTTEV